MSTTMENSIIIIIIINICCWLNTAVLQRVSAAKVVHQVRGITSLGGDGGLA